MAEKGVGRLCAAHPRRASSSQRVTPPPMCPQSPCRRACILQIEGVNIPQTVYDAAIAWTEVDRQTGQVRALACVPALRAVRRSARIGGKKAMACATG